MSIFRDKVLKIEARFSSETGICPQVHASLHAEEKHNNIHLLGNIDNTQELKLLSNKNVAF
jgi:hypothetical protein